MGRMLLIIESLFIFVLLPVVYRFSPFQIPVLPLLWLVALYAWWQLWRNPDFDRRMFWNIAPLAAQLSSILKAFALAAFLLWLAVFRFAHQIEWNLVIQHPGLWLLVMILYPVLSAYPQSLVYRAFFFERYDELFPGKWTMIFASAVAFSLMHIIFRNWIAVGLTFIGGILFAFRYDKTGSLATSSFEHALYGCWIFSLGLGQYFYHGTIGTVGTLMHR